MTKGSLPRRWRCSTHRDRTRVEGSPTARTSRRDVREPACGGGSGSPGGSEPDRDTPRSARRPLRPALDVTLAAGPVRGRSPAGELSYGLTRSSRFVRATNHPDQPWKIARMNKFTYALALGAGLVLGLASPDASAAPIVQNLSPGTLSAAQFNAAGNQRSVRRVACEHHASSIAATTSTAAARSCLSGLQLM